jgi:hypothetical protein
MHIAWFFFFVLSLLFPVSSFSQQPPLSISIATPSSGATVPNGRLLVRGVVETGGIDVGVAVNGFRAAVQGNTFAVIVGATPDVVRLTATVTSITGATSNHTVNISVSAGSSADELIASPAAGVAPVTVNFSLHANAETTEVSLDADGDGVVDFVGATLDTQPFSYTQPGVYIATATARNAQGAQRTANAVIEILDRSQLDTLLQARWTAIKAGLSAGDTSRALDQILTNRREQYSTLFDGLGASVAILGNDMPAIEPVYFEANRLSAAR